MLTDTAPTDHLRAPSSENVTVGAVLAWIAADDLRCHSESVRPALAAALVVAGVEPIDAGVVVSVRALVARTAAEPALRTAVIPVTALPQHPLV